MDQPDQNMDSVMDQASGLKLILIPDVQPGEAHQLIRHAAENGVEPALDVLENYCKHGKCN